MNFAEAQMDYDQAPGQEEMSSSGAEGYDPHSAEEARQAEEKAALEATAGQFGLLPVVLPRETCRADAEARVRLLGRSPTSSTPWVPVATLGPLVVMAHHDPRADDLWGIPQFLTARVVISPQQYESIRRDLAPRITARPLEAHNSLENLAPPPQNGNLGETFEWFLENYPLEQRMVEQLGDTYREMTAKNKDLDISDFNSIQEQLGVAMYALASQGPALVFNPDEVGDQNKFSPALLEKHGVYPLFCGRQRVYLLSEHFDNFAFEDEWLSSGNDPVEMVTVLGDAKLIRKAISKYSGASNSFEIEINEDDFEVSDDATLVEIIPEDVLMVNPQNVNHTPEELLHWVIYQAIHHGASDLHLEKYYNMVRFRARIDGQLRTVYAASEELLPRFIALVKNYANLGQSRQEAQDGRFGMTIGTRRIDARVAAVPHRKQFQKIIMRFLDNDDGLRSMADLNLSSRQADIFDRVMSRDQGLILITGPTGSGKTTTLYALLNSVNDDNINIQTIEDPIEYKIEGINQTQTDPFHNLTFLTGLRALLRADPDVILIGESRDEETATAAVNSALTGHLVLTTLHANDSLRAISRLLSMGVPSYLLSDALVLSQAQRLVRRLCQYCKRPITMPPEIQEALMNQGIIHEPVKAPIYVPVGCSECHQSGYKGRLALMEMCEMTSRMKDMIAEEAPMREVREEAKKNNLMTLYQEGLVQVLDGVTTMDEIKGLAYMA